MGSQKEEREKERDRQRRPEKMYGEIIAENFPKLVMGTNGRLPEAQSIPSKIYPKNLKRTYRMGHAITQARADAAAMLIQPRAQTAMTP